METINSQLDNLFFKWKIKFKENGEPCAENGESLFVSDGIMRKPNIDDNILNDLWKSSQRRIVLLLKDQNQAKEIYKRWSEDIRQWFVLDTPVKMSRFLQNIGRLVYSLSWISEEWGVWFNEIQQKHIDEAIYKIPFALIETKKLPGGSEIKDSELTEHINKYKDLLTEELDILNANIIICCGGPQHHFVLNEYFPKHYPWTYASKNVHYCKDKNTMVLYSGHPSVLFGSDEEFYNGCLHWVREFIKISPEVLTKPDK